MKLEQQVCTYEQAKRLNDLDIANEGIYMYEVSTYYGEKRHLIVDANKYDSDHKDGGSRDHWNVSEDCSAFTVAELGVMLPDGYDTMRTTGEGWNGYGLDSNDCIPGKTGFETEAEVRAAMLIYLLGNSLIEVSEINNRLTQ